MFFIDSDPLNGSNYYQVKAVKLETSGSGTYYNLSLGLMGNIDFTVGLNEQQAINFNIFPNPTNDYLNFKIHPIETQQIVVKLYNRLGQLVLVKDLATSKLQVSGSIALKQLPSGLYILKLEGDGIKHLTKVIKI